MNKRGMTLIELMVSMTIFITVMTLSIGSFIAISRSRSLISGQKETQQKIRVANEMIVRYAKQAEYVSIPSDREIQLFFDIDPGERPSAKRFVANGSATGPFDLLYYECQDPSPVASQCSTWGSGTSLFGGTTSGLSITNTDIFGLSGYYPAVLNVKLVLQNNATGYPAFDNSMTVENAIILEGLK